MPERGDDPRPLDEQLAARGSRVPITVVGRPLFLQRGWDDDELRAFPNTCTHAWYPLVLGATRGPTLVCAQHGRRFDCTGRFVSQQGFGRASRLPAPVRSPDRAAGRAWRRLTGRQPRRRRRARSPTSLARGRRVAREACRAIPSACRRSPRRRGQLEAARVELPRPFHIGFVHRAPGGLADAIDSRQLHDRAPRRTPSSSGSTRATPADGFDPALPARALPRSEGPPRVRAVVVHLPEPDAQLLSVGPLGERLPADPRPPRRHAVRLVPVRARPRPRTPSATAAGCRSQVDAEDVDALAQVNRGLRSGFAPRGRFAPEHEQAAHWFHRKVSRAVSSATLS